MWNAEDRVQWRLETLGEAYADQIGLWLFSKNISCTSFETFVFKNV